MQVLSKAEIQKLPFVTLENLESLPKTSGIYFALGLEGEVLYIGMATNFRKRWQGHHRYWNLMQVCSEAKLYFFEVSNTNLAQLESELIELHNPKLNNKTMGYRKYSDEEILDLFDKAIAAGYVHRMGRPSLGQKRACDQVCFVTQLSIDKVKRALKKRKNSLNAPDEKALTLKTLKETLKSLDRVIKKLEKIEAPSQAIHFLEEAQKELVKDLESKS